LSSSSLKPAYGEFTWILVMETYPVRYSERMIFFSVDWEIFNSSFSIFHIILVFKDGFPALTGILTLAYFIHNCILSIMRSQEHPENNVSSPARHVHL